MEKKSIQSRLQNQYNKLNNRIQKSIKTGRFYQYTQFKRDQLFARLERYSLQMKRLSMGLGVVAALGVSTPVLGQVAQLDLLEQTGSANPLDGVHVRNETQPFSANAPVFVDIDGDGDLDFFVEKAYSPNPVNIVRYFENIGTKYSADYQEVTGANNPFDGIANGRFMSFVDIDNDGDMDCFRGNNAYFYTLPNDLYYYKNEGNATTPDFVLQASNLNPLDSVVHHLNTFATTYSVSPMTTFSDIDNDGDMDCIVGAYSYGYTTANNDVWYYENVGSAGSASFLRREGINNPLSGVMTSIYIGTSSAIRLRGPIVLHDTDNDGDQDVLLSLYPVTGSSAGLRVVFAENQGTAAIPNFVSMSSNTPIDSTIALGATTIPPVQLHTLVDIDGDTDLDVFRVINNDSVVAFYENLDTTIAVALFKIEEENQINVFPNPSQGKIIFDKNITGQLVVYSSLGQIVYRKELENENEVDLSVLNNGIYFMSIEEPKIRFKTTILIKK